LIDLLVCLSSRHPPPAAIPDTAESALISAKNTEIVLSAFSVTENELAPPSPENENSGTSANEMVFELPSSGLATINLPALGFRSVHKGAIRGRPFSKSPILGENSPALSPPKVRKPLELTKTVL
jgi:hypothetical protein